MFFLTNNMLFSMASGSADDPYYESEGADDRKIIVRMLNYKTTNETIREYFGKSSYSFS